MPPTHEIRCTANDCFVDMFHVSYTYEVPDDHTVSDMACPACSSTGTLNEITL